MPHANTNATSSRTPIRNRREKLGKWRTRRGYVNSTNIINDTATKTETGHDHTGSSASRILVSEVGVIDEGQPMNEIERDRSPTTDMLTVQTKPSHTSQSTFTRPLTPPARTPTSDSNIRINDRAKVGLRANSCRRLRSEQHTDQEVINGMTSRSDAESSQNKQGCKENAREQPEAKWK